MKCEHCDVIPNDPIMECFHCSNCDKNYCFTCTNCWVYGGEKMTLFSNKELDKDSLYYGYNNYRNIKPFLKKFYCEHCLK